MSALTDKLEKAINPDLFGEDAAQLLTRLTGYETDAVTRVAAITPAPTAAKILEATELWVRYRAYSDAWDFELGRTEQTSVDKVGSEKRGDKATMLAALARARDGAKAAFDLIATPTATTGMAGRGITISIPVEVGF